MDSTSASGFEAFDDSDPEDGAALTTTTITDASTTPDQVAEFVSRELIKLNPQILQRAIGVWQLNDNLSGSPWQTALEKGRALHPLPVSDGRTVFDTIIIVLDEHQSLEILGPDELNQLWKRVLPGGYLVMPHGLWETSSVQLDGATSSPTTIGTHLAFKRTEGNIQAESCTWLPDHKGRVDSEQARLAQIVVPLASMEFIMGKLTDHSLQRAVRSLQTHGACILPGVVTPEIAQLAGECVLHDLQQATQKLKRQGVNLLAPQDSRVEPAVYRELSMREDLRMDLRHGPALDKFRDRSTGGHFPITLKAGQAPDTDEDEAFLRGSPIVVEVLRRAMNPKDANLSPGNLGRHNFSGSGPDGSDQDIRLGPVGGLVSLPGAADQAMHADTPHLWEHMAYLPSHYINVFTPGTASQNGVGQTAFVLGSHKLDFTAAHGNDKATLWEHLVRPRLELGDVILFDCRILHFGLANTSKMVQRPILYTNATLHWFHDPKNWDDERRIFDNPATV